MIMIDSGIISNILKFADDIKIFGKVGTVKNGNKLRRDLEEIVRWSENWQMGFNVDKCKVMHIGRNNRKVEYFMEGRKLEKVKEEKDLGIMISDNLKVNNQCVKAAKKGNQILGLISRTMTCRNKDVILKLYKTLVRPHLEYCIQAWRPHLLKDINILEKVQRRATRMIVECKGKEYEERLEIVGLTTLERRRTRADLIEVFKILGGNEGIEESTFFRRYKANTRGHTMKLFKKGVNRDILKYSFANMVVDMWNGLPEAVINGGSVNIFKRGLDKYLRGYGGDS
jgi:ribonuclease P/MRP protein subunit RPP40